MAELNKAAELHVQTRRESPQLAVISVAGELDVSNAQTLESAVEQVVSEQPAELVFDLGELRFMDSAGIAVLLGATRRVANVRLREPSPVVRRVVEMTGLTSVLPITES